MITNNNDNGIQNGLNTHHQDQSIVLVSFKMMNVKRRRLEKPIPADLPESYAIIVILLINNFKKYSERHFTAHRLKVFQIQAYYFNLQLFQILPMEISRLIFFLPAWH